MKSARQIAILEIIAEKSIETQEDLADALRTRGFQVTQATVSRDIKELRLVKALAPDGSYRYATAEKGENGLNERLIRMFSETVVSMVSAYNHRQPAMARGAGNHRRRQHDSDDRAFRRGGPTGLGAAERHDSPLSGKTVERRYGLCLCP